MEKPVNKQEISQAVKAIVGVFAAAFTSDTCIQVYLENNSQILRNKVRYKVPAEIEVQYIDPDLPTQKLDPTKWK